MYAKGVAVVAITKRGVDTALKIKEALQNAGLTCKVYAPKKYNQNGVIILESKFADFIRENYSQIDAIRMCYGNRYNHSRRCTLS